MAEQDPANQPQNAAQLLVIPPIPETITLDMIEKEIVPSIEKALDRAAKIAVDIKDDASREVALDVVEAIKKDCKKPLSGWSEEYYRPVYNESQRRYAIFNDPIKKIDTVVKTIMGKVADYNLKKDREERLAREKAEADARRLREEAERKQKEAEEAERRAKQAAEDEKRRKEEAEAAEKRRIQAEVEAKERREREVREASAAETKRKLNEEEAARIQHAEVAQAEGNGAAKVDIILENATSIAPVLAKPTEGKTLEQQRLEQEQATRVAEEQLLLEEKASAEAAERKRLADEEVERTRKNAEDAQAAATAAAAAAATTSLAKNDESRTFGVDRYVWDLDSDGSEEGDKKAIYALLEAILLTKESAVPIPLSFIGYDEKNPQKFRPSAIGESVTDSRERFSCPGIKTYIQRDERFKPVKSETPRRQVGGRR